MNTDDVIQKYVGFAKDRENPFRIMGFGHRVYKNRDPRATEMQKMCHRVLNELNAGDDELMEIAMQLEKIALND